MTATYDCIATTTLGSAAANITFTSISGSYTDLVIVFEGKVSANDDLFGQVNADTASNYSYTILRGNGTTAASTRASNATGMRFSDYSSPTTSNACLSIIHIQNYSNTTTNKTALARSNNASTGVDATVSLWRSTSAITSFKIYCGGGANLASGSIATLYGIKAE